MNDWYDLILGLGATMGLLCFLFMILSILKELTDEEDTKS